MNCMFCNYLDPGAYDVCELHSEASIRFLNQYEWIER